MLTAYILLEMVVVPVWEYFRWMTLKSQIMIYFYADDDIINGGRGAMGWTSTSGCQWW